MTDAASSIRVFVLDDSALVREGLRAVLHSHGRAENIQVVGEADTVAGAVRQIKVLKPDVALMDIRLPDGSGLDACKQVVRLVPSTRVVMLTSVTTDELIHQAALCGAQGYLIKEIDPHSLVRAIVDARAGRMVLTPEVGDRVFKILRDGAQPQTTGFDTLSPQELRVLALVAKGLTNKEVGKDLGLSDNTVKNYLVSVFDKLQVKRRSEAAALFATKRPTGR